MIGCLSVYQENYKPLAELTLADNRMEYCERHGYLPVFREYPDMPGAPVPEIHRKLGFAKLDIILDVFEEHPNCAWAWFGDCDGMVTNMRFPLPVTPHTSQGLLVSRDCHGICAGTILAANRPWVKDYFRQLLADKDKYAHEQDAIIATMGQLTEAQFQIIPQRLTNSYDYGLYPDAKPKPGFEEDVVKGQWQKGDFFVHWPGRTLEQRIAHYHEYAKEVVR